MLMTVPAALSQEGVDADAAEDPETEAERNLRAATSIYDAIETLDKMRDYLTQELPKVLPEGGLRNLEVAFFSAATSSLDYEIEVDLTGEFADQYEEVGRILSRLLVDACNLHGREIPFQHITVHQTTMPVAA